ncbi:MAG: tRNA pseudouridine(13) synthase TruD [Candidatus Omnitrophica bacterium]|nr:tRNA pseudouridine(13) synthase TruD [Candidatus Omnitrophota bacterium]
MNPKIKVRPEDFRVEEVAALPLVKAGAFGVYSLQKKLRNTVELLQELSRKLDIPFRDFSYGGRKDRHALTTQYITVRSSRRLSLEEENYSLRFVGYMRRPMGPDLIQDNRFEVTARKLGNGDITGAQDELKNISACGFPNYFDDQRFGSFDSRQGFLAEKLLKQQFNGALKIYLTSVHPNDEKEERRRKGLFVEYWKDWKACRQHAKTRTEAEAFDTLIRKPAGLLEQLKKMPRNELSTYISAYQSYLWNEVLRCFLKAVLPEQLRPCRGAAGEYFFYSTVDPTNLRYLDKVYIPMPGAGLKIKDEIVRVIYSRVLQDNGIKMPMFNKLKLRQAFFKPFERKAIVKPANLSVEPLADEIYPGDQKLILKFCLPRGSYATMFLKRIFSGL